MEETFEEESEEQARLVTCLREAVTMEAARFWAKMKIEFGTHCSFCRWLEEIGQREAALECCESLGEKGKELKIELCAGRA